MKVALLSESPADEAALRILVEAVLAAPMTQVRPGLRARGWPNVAQVLPAILRHLHFNTDTEALVVVVDSDDSVVHTADHEAPGYYHPQCRLCQLRGIFHRVQKRFPPLHGRERVLRGVGIAVPAIEAWYLCGHDPQVTELAWLDGQARGRAPYTRRELKWRVYGTDRPGLGFEIQRAVECVRRHQHDPRRLETDFPHGFGTLAHDLRGWGRPPRSVDPSVAAKNDGSF
ncbi:MAG TPA: hypothetical protein VMD31_13305 [Opitutaceae bacterium]|nr:hypothetical protein [Opitutaceae bacterium]